MGFNIAKYADFDHILYYQLTQLDQKKNNCLLRYRQKTDWNGAIIVGKRFFTLALWRKHGLFDPANEAEYRRSRNDIPNTYQKGCEYSSIDILLGFGGSIFIHLWDFDRCRFGRLRCSCTLVGERQRVSREHSLDAARKSEGWNSNVT
jgi:hypothetical protein